jgi:LDH2 family malate/lactate/ureidoglycolate dehydrogenase
MGRDVVDFNADAKSATNTGHAIVAIDPAAFGEIAEFKAAVDRLVRELRASARLPGVERIFVPGEQSHARTMAYRREGIPVAAAVVAQLADLAAELGVPPLSTH